MRAISLTFSELIDGSRRRTFQFGVLMLRFTNSKQHKIEPFYSLSSSSKMGSIVSLSACVAAGIPKAILGSVCGSLVLQILHWRISEHKLDPIRYFLLTLCSLLMAVVCFEIVQDGEARDDTVSDSELQMMSVASIVAGVTMALLVDSRTTEEPGWCYQTEIRWKTLVVSTILGIAITPVLFFLLFPFWFVSLPAFIFMAGIVGVSAYWKYTHIAADDRHLLHGVHYDGIVFDDADVENMFASSILEIPEQPQDSHRVNR